MCVLTFVRTFDDDPEAVGGFQATQLHFVITETQGDFVRLLEKSRPNSVHYGAQMATQVAHNKSSITRLDY